MKDLEVAFFMLFLGLKEEKNKEYSMITSHHNLAYVFQNNEEYENYFITNGCTNIDKHLLELCKTKITTKGSIIALKNSCDDLITTYSKTKINSNIIDISTKKLVLK